MLRSDESLAAVARVEDPGRWLTDTIGRTSVVDLIWFVLFNLLAFQIYFQEEVGGLYSYIDEVTSLALFAWTSVELFAGMRRGISGKRSILMCVALLVLGLLFGVLGNLTSGLPVRISAIVIDIYTFCKFPIMVLCCVVMPKGSASHGTLWRMLVFEARILIFIMGGYAVLNVITGGYSLGMTEGFRYGLPAFAFVFYHPEVVNMFTLGLIVILLVDNPQGNRAMLFLALIVMCLTLRSKAMGFAAITSVMLITMRGGRFSSLHVLFGAIIAWFVANDQFTIYYENGESARALLTQYGSLTTWLYFPLGSGFATFGSAVTGNALDYSPLYYQYGFNNVWGLSPSGTHFISDTFWPVLTAQLGMLGAVCYTASIIGGIWLLYRRMQEHGRGAALAIMALYLAICTTASSALFAPQWIYVMFAIYMGMRTISVYEQSSHAIGRHAAPAAHGFMSLARRRIYEPASYVSH